MIFKTIININFKWNHYKARTEHSSNTITKEELLKFEEKVVASNPYISKVFEIIKEDVVKEKVKKNNDSKKLNKKEELEK